MNAEDTTSQPAPTPEPAGSSVGSSFGSSVGGGAVNRQGGKGKTPAVGQSSAWSAVRPRTGRAKAGRTSGRRSGSLGSAGGAPVIDVYARLSKAFDGSMVKVDDQVDDCTDAIADRGGVVGRVFKDNSLSAWRPGVVRPDWDELMRRLESGASDGVMVYDVTRFSRKILEGERLIAAAENGVRVWALAGEYDLTTADGRAAFRDAMVAAAKESDKISERTARGKKRRAKKGRHHGGERSFAMPGWAPRPEGWEPGDPRDPVPAEVVDAEREIVAECYRRLLAGEGLSTVVWDLNARGVGNVHGQPWRRSGLGRTLLRPAMAGLLAHKGEIVGELAGVEPIVAREEWERLCGLFAGRKRGRPAGRVHWLSGGMACLGCGRWLTGVPRRNSTPYPDGSPKREYRCRRDPETGGCGRNHIDALTAETIVAQATKARLSDPGRVEQIAAQLAETADQRAAIETEIGNLNDAADELALRTAAWGVARVDAAMQPLLDRLQALHTQLADLTELAGPGDSADLADLAELGNPEAAVQAAVQAAGRVEAEWDDAFDRQDFTTIRTMVKRAFPHLTLMPGRFWGDHSEERFLWDGPPTQST